MKKIFSTILVFLLVFTMAFAVVGCGKQAEETKENQTATDNTQDVTAPGESTVPSQKDEEPSSDDVVTPDSNDTVVSDSNADALIGTWKAELNYGELLPKFMSTASSANQMFPADVDFSIFNDLNLAITLTFDKDGNATLTIPAESANSFISKFEPTLKSFLTSTLEAQATQLGITVDALLQTTGMTVDQILQTAMSYVDLSKVLTVNETFQYRAEYGKLYIIYQGVEEEAYINYMVDDTTLSLISLSEDVGQATIVFPLALTRQ